MGVRRKRRPGSDRLYVTTDGGLPLGHLDLITREQHDVPVGWRDTFRAEVNGWLWQNGMPPVGSRDEDVPMIEASTPPPAGGWEPGEEDLGLHLPGHGLADEASRLRAEVGHGADRPARLRADGQHAVADALAKLSRGARPTPGLRRGRAPRWRILHTVPMVFEGGEVLLDHVVFGPAGVFVVEVHNIPGGRVVITPEALEIDKQKVDLGRLRRLGKEAEERLSEALAIAAGAETTLNPPPVTPVVAVVGAVVIGSDRPRGVLVSRVGHLPRLLQAFGDRLVPQAVEQTFAVARRSVTWTR